MNILYLTNHLNIGGITSYVLSLCKGLKKRGHNIYLASYGGDLLGVFKQEGVTYISIPLNTKKELSPNILISKMKLSNLAKQFAIDIIHSNSRTTQVLGCLLSLAIGIPHISTCHGFFKARILRKIFPCWGKKVIAISESVKVHLMRDFRVKEENIRVVSNGIDVNRFKEEIKTQREQIKKGLGLSDGPVIGIVARLSEEKGHIYLIEAMRIVVDEIPKAQLLIVGDGRMKETLVNLTKAKGLENNIFFLPSVRDTKIPLSVMDIFVLPSLKEGLGLALMEAMASGICVIGSDIGGIRSLIQDGYNGRLVKPMNSPALTNAIIELLQDEDRRESFGREAQTFISQNFSLEKMVLETERVYLECL